MKEQLDFIIIGAMKCGTTTLSNILRKHPKVSISKDKEPDFFSLDKDWKKNLSSFFNKNFENEDEKNLFGEASTSYTSFPHNNLNLANDLYEHNPNLKLIYLVRDPVDRAVSHYMHHFSRGYTKKDIKMAIITEPIFIDRGLYSMQLKPFLDRFGKDNILILPFELFFKDVDHNISQVYKFLNIEKPIHDLKKIHSNKGVNNSRRNFKLDPLYEFIYTNPLGKGIRNLVPDSLRKLLNKKLSKSFNDKVETPDYVKHIIARRSESDVLQLEGILGRELNEWENYKNALKE